MKTTVSEQTGHKKTNFDEQTEKTQKTKKTE